MKRWIRPAFSCLAFIALPLLFACSKDANTRANEQIVSQQRKQKERLQKQNFELQRESIKQKDRVRESNMKSQSDRDKQLKTESSAKPKSGETFPKREKIPDPPEDEHVPDEGRGKFIE